MNENKFSDKEIHLKVDGKLSTIIAQESEFVEAQPLGTSNEEHSKNETQFSIRIDPSNLFKNEGQLLPQSKGDNFSDIEEQCYEEKIDTLKEDHKDDQLQNDQIEQKEIVLGINTEEAKGHNLDQVPNSVAHAEELQESNIVKEGLNKVDLDNDTYQGKIAFEEKKELETGGVS